MFHQATDRNAGMNKNNQKNNIKGLKYSDSKKYSYNKKSFVKKNIVNTTKVDSTYQNCIMMTLSQPSQNTIVENQKVHSRCKQGRLYE